MSATIATHVPWLGFVQITGADRATWLNGLITWDVPSLGAGESHYAAALDGKGRCVSDLHVLNDGERLLLEVPAERAARLIEHLSKRLVIEDAVLTERSDLGVVTVQGELADELTAERTRVERSHAGESGFDLVVPREYAEAIVDALVSGGAERTGTMALEAARIAAAVPRFGADFDEQTIPLEAGLRDAIHWSKGCYLGQEVIARMAHRGHTTRELRLLSVAGESIPRPGAELWPPGGARAVGQITSATRGAAIGRIRRKHLEPGTALQVRDGDQRYEAVIVDVPMRPHAELVEANDPTSTRKAPQTGMLR